MRCIVALLLIAQTFAQTPTFEEAAAEIRSAFGISVEVDEGIAAITAARKREKSENPFAYLEAVCKANGKAILLFDEGSNEAHIFQTDYTEKSCWSDDKIFLRIEAVASNVVDGKEHKAIICSIAICNDSVCAVRVKSYKMNGTEAAIPGDPAIVYRTKHFLTEVVISCPASLMKSSNDLAIEIETIECIEKPMTLKDRTDVSGISFGIETDTQIKKTAKLNIEGSEVDKFCNEFPFERRVACIQALSDSGKELPTLVLSATSGKKCYICFAIEDSSLPDTIGGAKFILAESLQKQNHFAKFADLRIK